MRQKLVLLLAVLGMCVFSILYSLFGSDHNLTSSLRVKLDFVPSDCKMCQQLFLKTSATNFSMSPLFQELFKGFDVEFRKATKGVREGFSKQLKQEYLALHYLASQKHVRTICETGFNFGHSSLNFLTANAYAIVHSFDLGIHKYALNMSAYIQRLFPNRFFIHFGDSIKTIPKFIEENPDVVCDMMFVDGGHRYDVALSDITQFARIANLKRNVMIFDDYPTASKNKFGKAWEESRLSGVVEELMRCSYGELSSAHRGFTIGEVRKRPILK